ncbi:indole-3-glycerol phosphate synthase TrpC [Mucilaginibacter myungsuensis]|uniref:Indole-3-glycerol phosphate synthase n=1 Tax=Mucilaginibacter myungsuensis TaxID=649104 RepID=A0A929PZ61_9SPHI|nr:indole-3-glycerol phosphate synthase TrpC [Mucilaginibacter myungsuensis]MBE9664072.1 indole-3-glycerol phosphate synthase TrpC [Mucilaginibacter myungsuensis]MDN3601250.1 indole-3-glycerol phosphate synthase TrpC [Mucilaginibacter myungsuensis]
MSTILDKIVLQKKEVVALSKQQVSIAQLEASEYFQRAPYSLRHFLTDPQKTGIIAEFKRRSPSKGIINDKVEVTDVTAAYAAAGASAISVLTDTEFFMGKPADLIAARGVNTVPLLRKDFMIDEYQILEAKAMGADIILLIAAILTPDEIQALGSLAKSLGMSVLLEVHSLEELQRSINPNVDAIGVNNRNLADFTVSVETSFRLAEHIPSQFLKVSESAISDVETIKQLKQAGFNGFLIGENFMRQEDPGAAMREFVKGL